jgi:hypothetical protein
METMITIYKNLFSGESNFFRFTVPFRNQTTGELVSGITQLDFVMKLYQSETDAGTVIYPGMTEFAGGLYLFNFMETITTDLGELSAPYHSPSHVPSFDNGVFFVIKPTANQFSTVVVQMKDIHYGAPPANVVGLNGQMGDNKGHLGGYLEARGVMLHAGNRGGDDGRTYKCLSLTNTYGDTEGGNCIYMKAAYGSHIKIGGGQMSTGQPAIDIDADGLLRFVQGASGGSPAVYVEGNASVGTIIVKNKSVNGNAIKLETGGAPAVNMEVPGTEPEVSSRVMDAILALLRGRFVVDVPSQGDVTFYGAKRSGASGTHTTPEEVIYRANVTSSGRNPL